MSDDRLNTSVHVSTSSDSAAIDAFIRKLVTAEKLIDKINKAGLGSTTKRVSESLSTGNVSDFLRRERGVVDALNRTSTFQRRMNRQARDEEREAAEERRLFRADDLRHIREVMGVRSAMARQQERQEREAAAAADRAANARTRAARETAKAEEQAARRSADAWSRAHQTMSRGAGMVRSGSTRAVVGGAIAAGVVGAGARRGLTDLVRSAVSIDDALVQSQIHVYGQLGTEAAKSASMALRKRLMPTAVKLGTSTADLISATVEAAQAGVDDSILGQVTEMGAKYARMNKLNLPNVLEETGYAIQGLKTFGKVTDETVGKFFNHSAYLVATTAANRTQMNSFAKRGLAAGASVGMSLDDTLAFGAAATASGAEGNQAARMLSTQTGRSAQWEMKSRDIARKSRKSDEDRLFLQIPSLLGMGSFRNIASGLKTNYFDTFATIQEKLRTVADPLKRRMVEKELFGQEFGALTDSLVMGGNLRDYRKRLQNPEADNFLEKNWNKQEGSFGFILDQMKSVFGNLRDSLGLALKPIYEDIRNYVVALPDGFGNLEDAFKSGLSGFLRGIGSPDGTMAGALKSMFGNPAGFNLNARAVSDFAKGFGEGMRSVYETVRKAIGLFAGSDASAESIGKLAAQFMGLSVALAALSPVVTVVAGITTALVGLGSIVAGVASAISGAAAMIGRALNLLPKGVAVGEVGAGAAGIAGRPLGTIGRLAPAFGAPLTMDPSKADQDRMMRKLGGWALEQERNRRALDKNTDALIQKQSYGGEGSLSGLIHKASLSSSDAATMRAGVQLAALNSGSIASAAASGSVGSVMSAAGIGYTPGAGGSALSGNVPGRSFSTPGVGARYGMGSGVGASDNSPIGAFRGSQTFDSLAPRISADLRKDFGLSKEEASAVLGNLGHESGGFRHMQELAPRGGRGGWGWAQWTGSRRRAFEAWTAQRALDPKSYEANYGFLRHELQTSHKGAIGALKRAHGLEGKTAAFEGVFEVAGVKAYGSRNKYARRAMGLPDGVAGVAGPETAPTLADKAGTMLGKGILKADKDMGDGMKTSGWHKAGPEELAKESPPEKLAREAPSRSGGAARGGGTTHAPITINTHGQDPETTASAVQKHITESNRYQTHDIGFESI